MSVPDVIPIAHEPRYRTDTIGTYDDGQFFAAITGAYREEDEIRHELIHLPRECPPSPADLRRPETWPN